MTTTDVHPTDVLAAGAAVASLPGTILLHDGRAGGRRVLLCAPRWSVRREADGRTIVEGDAPPRLGLDDLPPAAWAAHLEGAVPRIDGDDVPWLAGAITFEAGLPLHDVTAPASARFTIPRAWMAAYDVALVQDGEAPARWVVRDLEAVTSTTTSPAARLEAVRMLVDSGESVPDHGTTAGVDFLDRGWHRRAVGAIQEHLRRGDVYQINLTGQVTARTDLDPFEGFRREVATNPTAFGAFLRLREAAITSHSPELLLRLRGDRATTGPIKGTAPSRAEDALRASAKDRAEHVMIVDLCRHDLGRVAVPGSVRVDPLMASLPLRRLTHLVSSVHARVDPARRADLLTSLFPGGSITGAPKRRALEIIRTVENEARGPYTGTIGGLAPSGAQDWSIAIRTAVWQDGAVHFGCGGGIVLDSDPDAEFEEARLKARSFFESLGVELTP